MLSQVVKFSFFSVNMENLVDEAKPHQGTLEHDVGPGSGKDDEDDELEALRLAAINSMRPKEKAEPPTDGRVYLPILQNAYLPITAYLPRWANCYCLFALSGLFAHMTLY